MSEKTLGQVAYEKFLESCRFGPDWEFLEEGQSKWEAIADAVAERVRDSPDLAYAGDVLSQMKDQVVISCPQGVFELDRTIYGTKDNLLIIEVKPK